MIVEIVKFERPQGFSDEDLLQDGRSMSDIYQGVTLGALSFPKDERGRLIRGYKRHPTVNDHVTIYAGASIHGGETVIGKGSVIGGTWWHPHE